MLEYSISLKLLTEHHLECLSLKEAAQARLSLHLSKCHIVGNHMSRLKCTFSYHEEYTGKVYLKFSKRLEEELGLHGTH